MFILAIVRRGEIESDELFETKDQLTDELSSLIAELVTDGADLEDALDGLRVYQQVVFDKKFRKAIRKKVDMEVPLVIKKQRGQAIKGVDRLIKIASPA